MVQITRRPEGGADLFNLRRLNNMLDEMFSPWTGTERGGTITSAWFPPCDVFEDAEKLKIVMEIPGVKSEDVKLSLENNTLTIRGEKRQEAEEKSDRVHRYERSYGSFERSFVLPSTVDADRIEARCDNGVLTIELPKAERARPREIPVSGGGTGSPRLSPEPETGMKGGTKAKLR